MEVSKNRGKIPKMDGENNGKPYEQMDDLGGFPIFLETPIYVHGGLVSKVFLGPTGSEPNRTDPKKGEDSGETGFFFPWHF